jgi:rare lipoprotein A
MKVVGELQGKTGGMRTRAGLFVAILGLSASVVASPTVKREIAAGTGNHSATSAKRHWYQIGKASWYGPGFHGRTTANGETYDMYAMTCAHRTLPLGTWVRVTNLHNQKSIFLRVNDRGPMATSLIVDLSFAAAQKLDFEGLAKVKIEVVPQSDPKLAEQLVAQLPMSQDPSLLFQTGNEPSTGPLAMVTDR